MNTYQAAVVRRLTAAGLLAVAERAAKREGLSLAHVIAPGEVTGGHRTLWAALAKEKKTAAQIAAIVDFPEAVITAELPAPTSGPRVKKARPERSGVARAVPTAVVPSTIEPLFAAMEDRIERLRKSAARAAEEADLAKKDLDSLRATLRGVEAEASGNARALAVAHLRAHGDTGAAVEIAERVGVTPERLLSGSMQRDVCLARREIAVHFAGKEKRSHAEIGRMLNVGSSAIGQALQVARAGGRKAAA